MSRRPFMPGAVLQIVRHGLRQHWLGGLICATSVALATGLAMAVFAVAGQAREAFCSGPAGFDGVLGARGSQLQLVLNSVFHLDTSPGNIPWGLYEAVRQDPRVEAAVPYAVGDNYLGWRLVGTTPELFGRLAPGRTGAGLAEGRLFEPGTREAVVGSFAAQRSGLKVGATFKPFHGLYFDKNAQHEEIYTVVGVLSPTNSPADRVVWTSLDAVYRMKGHVLRGAGREYEAGSTAAIPDADKEVSAVMLKLRNPMAGFSLEQTVNRQGKVATLAWPIARVMADLFDRMGWAFKVLGMVSWMVVLVSCGAILATLHGALSARRRDFAILRALGAPRSVLSTGLLAEAATLSLAGALVGFLVYLAVLFPAASLVRAQTGVVISPWHWHPALVVVPVCSVALGVAAGVLPAVQAYATDVADNLKPLS